MPRRPCLEPGCSCLAVPGKPRCYRHLRDWDQRRNTRRTHYHGDWTRIAATAVAAHRAQHGNWCPGWQRPPHPAVDLTADHIDPRSLSSGVRVLCRSCNGRRGNRPD